MMKHKKPNLWIATAIFCSQEIQETIFDLMPISFRETPSGGYYTLHFDKLIPEPKHSNLWDSNNWRVENWGCPSEGMSKVYPAGSWIIFTTFNRPPTKVLQKLSMKLGNKPFAVSCIAEKEMIYVVFNNGQVTKLESIKNPNETPEQLLIMDQWKKSASGFLDGAALRSHIIDNDGNDIVRIYRNGELVDEFNTPDE